MPDRSGALPTEHSPAAARAAEHRALAATHATRPLPRQAVANA